MSEHATTDLITQLGHFATRAAARKTLMELRPCPVDALLAALADPSLPLNQRWAAMMVLGHAKAREAIPAILEAMKSESNLIDEAANALAAITGLDCGLMVEDWERELGPGGKPPAAPADSAPAACGDRDWLQALTRQAVGDHAESVEWDDGGYVHSEILLDGREQQIILAPGNLVGLPPGQILVYTECGVVPAAEATAEFLDSLPPPPLGEFGATEVAGGVSLTLRHAAETAGLTADALGKIILAMARYADSLEELLTGRDRV